jgi:Peptidase M61 N-terminal domain
MPLNKLGFSALLLVILAAVAPAQTRLSLNVDATEAARNVIHIKETLTVRPGKLTLFYPKWIPGEHAPTGPLNDMVGLTVTAAGKPLVWERDDVEMFAFHVTILGP